MRGRALDPELIRTFLVAAELRNFTRAGEKIGLTQQAVSGQISRLEAIVGRPLFIRKGPSMRLTVDAEVLAAYMRQTQEVAKQVEAHFSAIPVEGSVCLGMEEGYALKGLPAILAAVHQQRPRIRIYVEVGPAAQLMVRMQNQKIDLLLGCQRAGSGNGTVLWSEQLRWIGDTESYKDPETPIPLATRPEPSAVRAVAVEALTKAGRRFEVVFESDSFASLRAAFNSGIGLGVSTDTFTPDIRSGTASPSHLPDLGEMEYFIQAQNLDDPIVSAFADLVKTVASDVLQYANE